MNDDLLDRLPLLPDEEQYIMDLARIQRGTGESRMAIAATIARLVADGIETRRRLERAIEAAA